MSLSNQCYSLSHVYEGSCRLSVAADGLDQYAQLTWTLCGKTVTFEMEKHVRPVILEHLGD